MKRFEAFKIFSNNEAGNYDHGVLVCPPRRTPANADLIDRLNKHAGMEIQWNVAPCGGELVEGKGQTWTNGTIEWFNQRWPANASGKGGDPIYTDFTLKFPPEIYSVGFGSTGWDGMAKCSRWVAFDFDNLVAHAKGVGVSDEKLAKVKVALSALPYVETRNSTSGVPIVDGLPGVAGIHAYVYFNEDGIPTANHTEHAGLARCILGMMSAATNFDFSSAIDCCGQVMWCSHRKMSAENHGLEITKPAAKALSVADLPVNWSEHIDVMRKRQGKVRARGIEGIADEDQDLYEKLGSSRRVVPLDEGHKALVDELLRSGFTTIWLPSEHLLQTHTCALAKVMPDLKIKGIFKTLSDGNNPGEPNCFLFPLLNGAWRAFRFSLGIHEAETWNQDGNGWTTCYYNKRPSLAVAAKVHGGMMVGKKVGQFAFDKAPQAVEVAKALGQKIDLPEVWSERKRGLSPTKDGLLLVEIDKEKDDKPAPGWLAEHSKWTRVFAVSTDNNERQEYETRLPIIELGTDVQRVVDETIAKGLVNDPAIYQNGALFVISTPPPQPRQSLIKPGVARLVPLSPALILTRLSSLISYRRYDVRSGEWVPAKPDKDVVSARYSATEFQGVRVCNGVVSSPILRPDGTIANTPGFDEATGLYFDIRGEFPALMGKEEAKAALLEVFQDFPFQSDAHRSAAVAALITLFCRRAFPGPAPLFLFDANASRTGKGKITDAIITIFENRAATRTTMPNSNEEFRKVITSFLIDGCCYIVLDNIDNKLGGGAIEGAITAEEWRDRILGRSEMVTLPMLTVLFGTGNNVQISPDMAPRIAHCRLQTSLEQPDTRTGFRHENLLGFCSDGDYLEKGEWKEGQRRKLVMAALSIPAGYIAAGRPDMGLKAWGGFEGWSNLVRSSLVWAGIGDCDSRDTLREVADEEVETLATLHDAMAEIPFPVTVARAVELAGGSVPDNDGNFDMNADGVPKKVALKLAAFLEPIRKDQRAARLGNLLKKFRGKPLDGRQIVVTNESKRKKWSVEAIKKSATQPVTEVGAAQ